MNYNIRLENGNEDAIRAFRSIVKMQPDMRIRVSKDLSREARKKAEIDELRAEVEQIKRDVISGKKKGYRDVDEMFRDMLND